MDAAIQNLRRPQARNIIDSLRDGVVPKHGAEFFTVGRERWLASIGEDLEDLADTACTDGRLRIINGRNGDGKTHLMHLIASQSLNANFTVGYLVVSKDTPLYSWNVVYGAIGRSLITKGNPDNGGLRVILNPDNPDPAIAADYRAKSTAFGACAELAASNRLTLTYSATRVFVKAVVETLELCNQHPGIDVGNKDIATMFGDVDGRLRDSDAKFAMDDDE